VVLALPEDMLTAVGRRCRRPRVEAVETWPGLADMARLQKRLWAAERPMVVLGGGRWSEAAVAATVRFAERFELPVAVTFRRQMLFPADHPTYAGDLGLGVNPKLLARIREADLLLVVGDPLSEVPSQSYTLMAPGAPLPALVHVLPDADGLGKVYQPSLAINASPQAFAAALEGLQPPTAIGWGEATRTARSDYLAWSETVPAHPGTFQMAAVVAALRALPEDAILTNGAGNYAIWLHRFHRFRRYGTQVAPTSGSMGYGLPAAIAAKLAHPDKVVVALAGDGCFQMTSQELATAMQAGAAVVVVVIDNGIYGTIRMHQERAYPGRVVGTDLPSPDFVALANSLGAHAERVTATAEFEPALRRALTCGRAALIEMVCDPRQITTRARLK
jgi:acetolactate synthase-1/2/3 large subunit